MGHLDRIMTSRLEAASEAEANPQKPQIELDNKTWMVFHCYLRPGETFGKVQHAARWVRDSKMSGDFPGIRYFVHDHAANEHCNNDGACKEIVSDSN